MIFISKFYFLVEDTEQSDHDLSNNRAVSPPEHTQDFRYTVLNEIIPNTDDIPINSETILGEKPVQCTCTNCHTLILTRVYQTPGFLSWIFCIILILFGCWIGCCLIPFCISKIQNTRHYCPNCKTVLGVYRPM
jgi:lipopolysaccharide-induced tumor necrosis factor-alpha factor